MEIKVGNYYKPKHLENVIVELIEIEEEKMSGFCQYKCKFDDEASKHGAYYWVKDTETFLKDMQPIIPQDNLKSQKYITDQLTLFDFI